MRKLLLLHLILSSMLYGYVYDKLLLTTHAVILPKLMMLDKNFDEKTVDGTVKFSIVYEEEDKDTALWFTDIVRKNYHNRIGNHPFQVDIVSYNDVNLSLGATAYYALNSPSHLTELYKTASSKERIIFAYDLSSLSSSEGALITIMNEKKTKIYLNKAMLSHYQVNFVPMFYQIAEFINE